MNKEREQFMKNSKPVLRVLAVVLAFACIATAADAPKPHFKFTTINHPKALQTSPYGINNSGDIVGYFINLKSAIHGFLLVNGKFTNIDDPKSAYGTEPINLNNKGTIVGSYLIDSSGNYRAFSYENGNFTDVGPTFCTMYNAAAGINDNGEIVGWCNSNGVVYGWLWDGKKYTKLAYPGANNFTLAWGINNAGLVTLQWIDSSNNYEAATYNSKTKKYRKLPNVPGAAQTYVHSINSAGDIVFSWDDSNNNSYGALCTNCTSKSRKWSTFSDPKSPDYTKPDGINDNHEIVGRIEPTGPPYEQGFKATYK